MFTEIQEKIQVEVRRIVALDGNLDRVKEARFETINDTDKKKLEALKKIK